MKLYNIPFSEEDIEELQVGDMVYISGYIYCGRDAVLPKVIQDIAMGKKNELIDLKGNVIFHTAVSPAGVGPTSSNKLEIEESILPLSDAGIKMHLGKGKLKEKTIKGLSDRNAVYAIIPPVTALLESKTLERECVAYPELGMEALYKVKVQEYPVIIAGAKGRSIYE